jgi:hypothetical protein
MTHDYNGPSEWSLLSLQERYQKIASSMGCEPKELRPRIHKEGDTTWIYPVMDEIIDAAKLGDSPALELCLQLIEQDTSMPFGTILKSQAARALKKNSALLSLSQRQRIDARITDMDARNYKPREFKEYIRIQKRLNEN